MLILLHSRRTLRLTSAGRLLPWLGPAFRGLVAMRFKRSVCHFSPEEQQTTRLYCKGCPHQRECPYGQTVEAALPESAQVFSGQDDGVRPLVVAPDFPLPQVARPGTSVPVLATFVGADAASHAANFWDAVAAAGGEGGLGPDGIGFRVEEAWADRWRCLELPRGPESLSGALAVVRVELTSPLMLRRGASEGKKREAITQPTFADLVRAGLRTLGALCRGYGQPVDADFAALREAAERVPLLDAHYRQFRQERWSSRTDHHGMMRGVTGWATFGPVPMALARWLIAAGLVHVGQHRVAGAGGWRVSWSMNANTPIWHDFD